MSVCTLFAGMQNKVELTTIRYIWFFNQMVHVNYFLMNTFKHLMELTQSLNVIFLKNYLMTSLELVGKCFKMSDNESQEDCYGLWRRSDLNSFPVLSKSCTCFFRPARSYVTNPSCSRVHMSPPHLVELDMLLLVWPAAPMQAMKVMCKLLGQSSFKRCVYSVIAALTNY